MAVQAWCTSQLHGWQLGTAASAICRTSERWAGNDESFVARDLMRKIPAEHRAVIYITTACCTTSQGPARGFTRSRRQGGAVRLCRGWSSTPTIPNCGVGDRATPSPCPRGLRNRATFSDHKTPIENFAARVPVGRADETLNIRHATSGASAGVWKMDGRLEAQLLRHAYVCTTKRTGFVPAASRK